MMKKLIAMLMIAAMLLAAVAFAEEYHGDDIAFAYDESAFEITTDDVGDNDDHLLILTGRNEAWGNVYIRFYTYMQAEDEPIPTAESVKELMPDVEVTEGEWNGFHQVVMYDNGDESIFLVALTTGELLTIGVHVDPIEDEEMAMERDDMISMVLDTLEIIGDTSDVASIYTQEEIDSAIAVVENAEWNGMELVSLAYAGDDCNTEENIAWLSGLNDVEYTEVLELLGEIHTTPDNMSALEPDTDYSDYAFWLARTGADADWELVTWGF